jgi:hypothetical protein
MPPKARAVATAGLCFALQARTGSVAGGPVAYSQDSTPSLAAIGLLWLLWPQTSVARMR